MFTKRLFNVAMVIIGAAIVALIVGKAVISASAAADQDTTFRTPQTSDYSPLDRSFHTPQNYHNGPVDRSFHTPPTSDYEPLDQSFHTPQTSDYRP